MSASGQSVRSLIEGLPPEIAKQVHPDWQKNEAEYWAQRDTLLRQCGDQWIGFAEGRVIASGTSPVEVFHAAQGSGKHPFVTRVGHENEPNRMRRAPLSFYSRRPYTPVSDKAKYVTSRNFLSIVYRRWSNADTAQETLYKAVKVKSGSKSIGMRA